MIKVLVADDDKLVRQGLISSMPWGDFGMEVVGEAKNGEKALEFLQTHAVDLLLLDLAMPVMSGMEVLRIVRKQFPRLHVVVLTLHQDFEYIQEALRLAAIDYIAKVELERDQFDQVLRRIRDRIEEVEANAGAESFSTANREQFDADNVWVLFSSVSADGKTMEERVKMLVREQVIRPPSWKDRQMWLWQAEHEEDERQVQSEVLQAVGMGESLFLLRVNGVRRQSLSELMVKLNEYREQRFFYDRRQHQKVYELSMQALCPFPSVGEKQLNDLKQKWATLNWVHESAVFERLCSELHQLNLPPSRLESYLRKLLDAWNPIYHAVTTRELPTLDVMESWEEVTSWLGSVRLQLLQAIGHGKFSQEVQLCISQAIQIVLEEFAGPVYAGEVARRVGMSRSYFSHCFKEWTGVTFNEYVRYVRMEKAQEYLRYTSHTVAWIAENTGYADEKYFSRTFRKMVGLLPSEYRQMNRKGGEMSVPTGE